MADDYGGLLGGFLFAFRRSDSYVLRAYVLVAAVVGAFAAILLLLGVVTWLATPAPIGQRALLGVIAIAVLVPLFAPVLVVARRHRRGTTGRRADAALGLAGFGFVLSVYLAGLVSAPDLPVTAGPLGPAIDAIDALPRRYWIVPPLLSVASIWLAVRLTRPDSPAGGRNGEGASTADGGDAAAGDDGNDVPAGDDGGRAEG